MSSHAKDIRKQSSLRKVKTDERVDLSKFNVYAIIVSDLCIVEDNDNGCFNPLESEAQGRWQIPANKDHRLTTLFNLFLGANRLNVYIQQKICDKRQQSVWEQVEFEWRDLLIKVQASLL
ncbi:MAG: hypothetical protein ACJA2B_002023 [Candidatus Endobugula sp.]